MIRGIDNQIAFQRLNEYAKDANAQLKQPELIHAFQARMNRAIEERQQQQVTHLEQKEDGKITRESDGSKNPSGQERRRHKKQDPESPYEDLLSGAVAPDPEHHHLDIEV